MKALIGGALFLSGLFLAATPIAVHAQTNNPGALSFDGSPNAFVQMPSGVWFNGDFTVEGWVYVRSYQNWSRLIDFADGPGTNNVYLALSGSTGGLPTTGVFTNNNGAPTLSASTQLPINQWAHLAATGKGTAGTIYINGNVVGTGTLNIAPNVVRSNNYVGRSAYAPDSYANAIFDELRIWNVARNQFQIQTFMSQPLLGPQTNLVGYWRFDDNTGTQASDNSGNNNPGTLQSGVTWTNFTAPISPGFGSALSFNGIDQTVAVPNQAALNTFPLTVMAWFKAPADSLNGGLVNKYLSSSLTGYQIFLVNGHLMAWYFRDNIDNIYSKGIPDAGPVNDGKWHHAAFVVDTNGGHLYLDGVLKSNVAWNGAPGPTTSTLGLSLGNYPGDSLWKGQLDEVSIWHSALSLAQIDAAAINGLTGTESNLLAYYRLDEGGGAFTADSSTNHFNGTVTATPAWVASFPPLTYSAQTISASPVSPASELLTGGVIPVTLDTTAWFQYGTTASYGSATAPTNWTDGFLPQRIVSMVVTGLLADTDYHFQMVCSNSAGIRTGADQVFHTARNVFVTSLADSGAGSLRQALATAQNVDTIHLTNGTITLTGGELAVSNTVSIVGINPSTTAISGNNASRVFNIASNGNVSLSFLTIENGRATNSADGGGIYNSGTLAIDHCVIMNNQAGRGYDQTNFISNQHPDGTGGNGGNGGGIANAGTLFLSRSTLHDNSAGSGGLGAPGININVLNFDLPGSDGGSGGFGGAIMNSGTASVGECTFFANASGNGGAGGSADGDESGGGGSGGLGGAIYNSGTLTIAASTLVQNKVGNGGPSGGAYSFEIKDTGGTVVVGTVFSSIGPAGGPGNMGGIYTTNGSATLQNTVVAQNSITESGDIGGVFNSAGHNFIGKGDGATGFTNGINGDLVGSNAAPLDPQVALFLNSRGVTPSYALLPGSPLKDAGDDSLLNPPYSLTTDQADQPRLVGTHVDIGAVESPFAPPTVVTLPVTPAKDLSDVNWNATLEGFVNPSGLSTTVYFQYGASTNYDYTVPASVSSFSGNGNTLVNKTVTNLFNGLAYHYRAVATNSAGISVGNDLLFQTVAASLVPGDINGDGIVDSSDLAILVSHLHTNGLVQAGDVDLVLSNYWLNAPGILLTNVSGLGGSNVTFGLTNYDGNFQVEYSSNLVDWTPLGRTSPLFKFTDTNAPAGLRYYRLRWP